MNKRFWIFTLIAAFMTAAFSLVKGWGTMDVTFFGTLALLLPIVLKSVKRFSFTEGLQVNLWAHAYSWLFWNTVFFIGGAPPLLSIQLDSPLAVAVLWFAVMFLTVVLMELTALGLTFFFKRDKKRPWLDSTLDIALITLPVPMTLLGHLFFLDLSNPIIASIMGQDVLAMLNMYILGIIVLTMLTLVFYWYPRNQVATFPRMVRIFATGFMWLAINGHVLFGGWMPQFVLDLIPRIMPIFQGNTIVYITPVVYEFLVIAVSVGIGVGLENLLKKKFPRFAD